MFISWKLKCWSINHLIPLFSIIKRSVPKTWEFLISQHAKTWTTNPELLEQNSIKSYFFASNSSFSKRTVKCLSLVHFILQISVSQSLNPFFFTVIPYIFILTKFFIYQLMHKRIALERILKFTLKQLLHVSVQSTTSGSALFELAKVTVLKIIN